MPLTSERFYPAPSGGADPDRYLILGFDTDRPEQRLEDELFNHGIEKRAPSLDGPFAFALSLIFRYAYGPVPLINGPGCNSS